MISAFDYKDNCWWCGNKADSGEHKYKKTDLVREFGTGPYKGSNSIVRVLNGKQRIIQGPDSQEAKFESNLCRTCNNAKSQPFDYEYDTFTTFIKEEEDRIYTTRQFKLSDIFGSNWMPKKQNLVRYFVKHICCRVAASNILIEPEIIEFLNGGSVSQYLSLWFEIREDIVAFIKDSKENGEDLGILWLGEMTYQKSRGTGKISEITSYIGYRWLRLNYKYDKSISPSRDNFSSEVVQLESNYNVDPGTIPKIS
ncbi:MAG TPA: hypothetical protein VFQ23_21995 [Anaerolineales bacterium]|nr:hypothetical protein [Anaerolineales bacterium]